MYPFLYSFFHNETNDRSEGGLVNIPNDDALWPESWKKVQYKTYSLFKPIQMEKEKGALFQNFLTKRSSAEARWKMSDMSLETLSYILYCGYGLRDDTSEYRTVPSAGKRFPLEVYIFIFKTIHGIDTGIYHYNVTKHALELVEKKTFSEEDMKSYSPYDSVAFKSLIIFFTGVFDRVVGKYGSRGYRYLLLEAGHAAQNMLLAGTEKGVQGIPIGGVNESVVEQALSLNTSQERIVYALFF
ncbi:MAG: SagB/ThcOx family dehydrogenase [Candidatus Paceibacterota bacterium]